ncbi:FAD-dependent monooxygenase [Pseudomonas sp. MAP12]|uniref:FAD-dependent monooxygenase n=1 Tax=Geopseudomonas aromaticivorans TaxID=2849492 RepID=A0ABS6MVQ2_9GAMM|nr:FAD-dependent monooxygenase [Pseudomonas aromaticivorans]
MKESLSRLEPRILVVGSGASGLALALACAHRGIAVRIIEKRPSRSHIQKATGVAQEVWHQLARFGITQRLIDAALPMRLFVFHDDERLVANVPVPLVRGQPPAHLYPQASLELAMEQALTAYGVRVEYGVAFAAVAQAEESAVVTLTHASGEPEAVEVDWLVGADGNHSSVRACVGMPFVGKDYPEDWSVAEISTQQWLDDVQAQLFLRSDGLGLFLSQPSPGVIQGILNGTGVAATMKARFPDATLHYERGFRVSLRRVPTPRCGRVWVIGDAAHVQSPVGGQGLNLAIWDGVTLGQGLLEGDQHVERRLARRAKRVLFFTDFDYRMLATRSRLIRLLRNRYWFLASRHPWLARWFFRIISGAW